MKKIFVITALIGLSATISQAQDVLIKGLKNQAVLVKGSRALPSVKFKDGQMVTMSNTEEGMTFTLTKNGKQFPLFEPVDATFGQVAETDIDGDGTMEILAAYRNSADSYTLNIFRKPQFEFDYTLWSTINGRAYAEFPAKNMVKLYTKDGSVSVMSIDSEGKLAPAK